MATSSARLTRFYVVHGVIPIALGVLAVFALEHTGLDRWLTELWFDPAIGNFPLRKHWLTEDVVHKAGKNAAIGIGVVAIALLIASRWKRALVSWRRPLVYFVACMALGPLISSGWKDLSDKRCPWDLEIYGGFAATDRILDSDPDEHRRGCFPCGQASAGFSLAAGYFALRGRNRRRARWALVFGLGYGTVLGIGRVLQGAHYASHVVATAVVCWSVSLLMYELILRRRDDQRDWAAVACSVKPSSPSPRAS